MKQVIRGAPARAASAARLAGDLNHC